MRKCTRTQQAHIAKQKGALESQKIQSLLQGWGWGTRQRPEMFKTSEEFSSSDIGLVSSKKARTVEWLRTIVQYVLSRLQTCGVSPSAVGLLSSQEDAEEVSHLENLPPLSWPLPISVCLGVGGWGSV